MCEGVCVRVSVCECEGVIEGVCMSTLSPSACPLAVEISTSWLLPSNTLLVMTAHTVTDPWFSFTGYKSSSKSAWATIRTIAHACRKLLKDSTNSKLIELISTTYRCAATL